MNPWREPAQLCIMNRGCGKLTKNQRLALLVIFSVPSLSPLTRKVKQLSWKNPRDCFQLPVSASFQSPIEMSSPLSTRHPTKDQTSIESSWGPVCRVQACKACRVAAAGAGNPCHPCCYTQAKSSHAIVKLQRQVLTIL